MLHTQTYIVQCKLLNNRDIYFAYTVSRKYIVRPKHFCIMLTVLTCRKLSKILHIHTHAHTQQHLFALFTLNFVGIPRPVRDFHFWPRNKARPLLYHRLTSVCLSICPSTRKSRLNGYLSVYSPVRPSVCLTHDRRPNGSTYIKMLFALYDRAMHNGRAVRQQRFLCRVGKIGCLNRFANESQLHFILVTHQTINLLARQLCCAKQVLFYQRLFVCLSLCLCDRHQKTDELLIIVTNRCNFVVRICDMVNPRSDYSYCVLKLKNAGRSLIQFTGNV